MSRKKILEDIWEEARKKFNKPSLDDPEIVDSLQGQNTAAFIWGERRFKISNKFIDDFVQEGFTEQEVIETSADHETGHYVFFPHDLWKAIYFGSKAEEFFPGISEPIYMFFSDMINEGELLSSGLGTKKLFKFRDTLSAMAGKDRGGNIVNKLLAAKYADSFHLEMPEMDKEQEEYFEKV